jgi:dTDP-L-rhamnose 4-epimerase
MNKNVLITGGAGFIGSHLADHLLNRGYNIRVLDNLCEQVHGSASETPNYLNEAVEFIAGDVRDPQIVAKAVLGMDFVFHLAAMVGVGQSMYEIKEYTDVNNVGTAVLLETLAQNPVEKLIVASSMSVYGEGLYKNRDGEISEAKERSVNQFKNGDWEVYNDKGDKLIPYPTHENKRPALSSVYALSKYDQERLCLMIGNAYNIPTAALRFFNVYGTRQSLSNPYTGVLAIFASRFLNNNPPLIFEDGNQMRDFVSVHDVTLACRLALENQNSAGEVFNIGSGKSITINEIAYRMARVIGKTDIIPEVTGKYRVGDIRHCFADISKAERILGFQPQVSFEDGLIELADWLKNQKAVDNINTAQYELAARGLTV